MPDAPSPIPPIKFFAPGQVVYDPREPIPTMYHTPGKFCYTGKTIGMVRPERRRLLQELHDERDLARLHQLKAEFFSPEDKSTFDIRLPLHCNYGYNIHIGAGASIGPKATILDDAKVTIGRATLLAPDVKIYTASQASDPDQRLRDRESGEEYRYPVTIGENCWIGGGATICPGVTIGDGITVAAGAVVTKDVEDRCLVAGVPARVVKRW